MKGIKVVYRFFHSHLVLTIALLCALITMVIVPPDIKYLDYIDFKTICCLFATLLVVCALKNIRFFTFIARKIVHSTPNLRICILALLYITFIGSLFIANDMALITFLPLGFFVLADTGNEKYMPWVFVLQNISANLGGMLTPFGNPQNLYIYNKFQIPTLEFMKIMVLPFLLAVLMLTLSVLFFPKTKMEFTIDEGADKITLSPRKTSIYLVLFVLSILAVFDILPYYVATIIIFVGILIFDRKATLRVDYPLLLTFVMFFIFAGNMSRIDIIRNFMSSLLEKNTLIVSALSCQVISNVPSAVLLSQFTTNYKELLLGVNIGGTGTIIASLASLITLSEFSRCQPNAKKRYLAIFTLLNIIFFVALLGFSLLIKNIL